MFDKQLQEIIRGFKQKGYDDQQFLKLIESGATLMIQDQVPESVLRYLSEQLEKTSPFGPVKPQN